MTSQDSPKVLVAIPTYEGKDYIFRENFEAIKNIDYPNYEYIYIDNSKTIDYCMKLRRKGANCVRVPRGANSRQALANSQNYARKKCLEEGFDYLMFIESDLVPQPDCIRRLMSYFLPVVGATYFIGFENRKAPCIFIRDWKEDQQAMGTRLINREEQIQFIGKGLQRVHGCGLGCTLIRRDIVARFIFWHDERFDNKHSDVYFYMELDNAKVPVHVDMSYVVDHFPSKWDLVKDK